jgi:aspartyl-tRNA(Asn)/glutamyl-tRNA(Gln) amidotransferase subunit B
VEKALEFEIRRQQAVLEDGGTLVQETRLWDAARGITQTMRGKEEAHDYRYFPDPDLVPVAVEAAWIEEIRRSLPELPEARRRRLVSQYGLSENDAEALTTSKGLADYFEACAQGHPQPKTVGNWIMVELTRELKRDDREIESCPVRPAQLAALLNLTQKGAISGKIAKSVLEEMYRTGDDPQVVIDRQGLVQMTDSGAIAAVIVEVLAAHPAQVADYRAGKAKVFGFFVGEVMKRTRGQANPQRVNQLLKEKLES